MLHRTAPGGIGHVDQSIISLYDSRVGVLDQDVKLIDRIITPEDQTQNLYFTGGFARNTLFTRTLASRFFIRGYALGELVSFNKVQIFYYISLVLYFDNGIPRDKT